MEHIVAPCITDSCGAREGIVIENAALRKLLCIGVTAVSERQGLKP
jgi:hypothetical protein